VSGRPLASQKGRNLGINAEWQNERGGVLGFVLDPRMLLSHIILRASPDLSRTVCVRFIDPYGNAVFNQEQIPILARELADLIPSVSEREARDHLHQIIELVKRAQGD